MSASESDFILHHYDTSPFSEKIRLVFGIKGIEWYSVEIPDIMPRPDLMPLTGGYRKTPVMQIGADIFCDTQIILREIEQRCPEPALYPAENEGLVQSLAMWTDRLFFQTTVGLVFGTIGDMVPDAFKKDREQLSGGPFNTDAMKQGVPMMKDQWRAQAAWLNAQLSDGKPFLLGDNVSLADVHGHTHVWFLRSALPDAASQLLKEFEHVRAWEERLNAFGHGQKVNLSSAEALEIGTQASPTAEESRDPNDPNGRVPGDTVVVMADDYGKDPIAGTLVSSSSQHTTILRKDPHAGDIAVHFPKTGFWVVAG